MAQRLTLSTTGIKSPLDVAEPPAPLPVKAEPAPARAVRRSLRSVELSAALHPAPAAEEPTRPEEASARFYGHGRPIQTSIALNQTLVERLDELGRATGEPVNAIAVAALQHGMPATANQAADMIRAERVRRIDSREPRLERNLRLPEQMRARLEELLAGARELATRATRADAINAMLIAALPLEAEATRALVASHARQREIQG